MLVCKLDDIGFFILLFSVSSFSTLVKQVKSSLKIYQQVPDT